MQTTSSLIFLVDDEPTLLDLTAKLLEDKRYSFRKFSDPRLALEAFATAEPAPQLMISDYAMPSMTGVELLTQCKSLRPELKTMLISGTVDETVLADAPFKVDCFLRKPCPAAKLKAAVGTVLAG